MSAPLAKEFDQRVHHVGRRVGLIEEIARAEHRVHDMLIGEQQEPRDGVEPGPRQLVPVFRIEAVEAHAKVPVGGVKHFEHDVFLLMAHAISNSTSSRRPTLGWEKRRWFARSWDLR